MDPTLILSFEFPRLRAVPQTTFRGAFSKNMHFWYKQLRESVVDTHIYSYTRCR